VSGAPISLIDHFADFFFSDRSTLVSAEYIAPEQDPKRLSFGCWAELGITIVDRTTIARINETNDYFESSQRLSHASFISTDFSHQYDSNFLPDALERQI